MKGFWRTMESVFAVIILMSFMLSLAGIYIGTDEPDMSSAGYGMLKELDSRGDLRSYVVSGDYSGLEAKISIPGHKHTVKICDYDGNCVGEYPDSQNIVLSTYIISGDSSYEPYEVRLYIW